MKILYENAKFYTMESEKSFVNKIITKNGLIYKLGSECENVDVDKVINLNNSFVYPGFHDAHMHLIGYGRKLNSNVLKSKNKESVLKEIKNFYNNENLKVEGYFDLGITKKDLDKISKDNYIILRHNDYHSFTVNSKVLKDLNITNKDGIIKDEINNKIINPLWEENNDDLLYKFVIDAITNLHKNGITSVHTDDLSYFNGYLNTLKVFEKALNEKVININTLIHYDVFDDYINSGYKFDHKNIKDIQVKIFYDGTIFSKTALLSKNYLGENNKGLKLISDKEFLNIIKKVRKYNKGLAIHVIGDKGLDNVLFNLSKFENKNEIDRIIHASLLSGNTLLKYKNQAFDVQPLFIKTDKDVINKYIDNSILKYPFKKYINNNILINSSSDSPVESINPILSIKELMKKDINMFDILKSYTVNPSKTINDNTGLLVKGKDANFTCFNKDLYEVNLNDILNTKVVYTIIKDKVVYKNNNVIK